MPAPPPHENQNSAPQAAKHSKAYPESPESADLSTAPPPHPKDIPLTETHIAKSAIKPSAIKNT
jgi:hypothetical protein